MKTKLLLVLFVIGIFSLNAQTTHNLNWFAGIGSNVDLTIESGDTVIWTWTSPNHTVENDPAGSNVELFDSGLLGPNGSTFSHTFSTVGDNDYYCSIHGAGSMSGTITVEPVLGVDEFGLDKFTINPNPSSDQLNIELPSTIDYARLQVYDVLGKQIISKEISGIEANVNVSNWNNGIYIVRVTFGDSSQTKRFVKQ